MERVRTKYVLRAENRDFYPTLAYTYNTVYTFLVFLLKKRVICRKERVKENPSSHDGSSDMASLLFELNF